VGRGRLFVGTSGFAYKEWVGDFYPPGTKSADYLACYAERLSSVEINYSFQRLPSPATLAQWCEHTPEGFVFSLKAHRRITHMARLNGVDEAVRSFLDGVAALGDRLGPVLFQCPPNLRYQPELLDSFLAALPPGRRYAMEFRHESWEVEEVRQRLAGAGVAWCVADTDEKAATFVRTAPTFAYMRLRRTAYDEESLAGWGKTIGTALEAGTDVYAYLKHEESAAGARWAEQLRSLSES
jgi:uncharacterized protein YecE (DUF72 family)